MNCTESLPRSFNEGWFAKLLSLGSELDGHRLNRHILLRDLCYQVSNVSNVAHIKINATLVSFRL